jgi:putative sterol carrier protein
MARRSVETKMAEPLPPQYLAEPDRYFMEWIPTVLAEKPELRERAASSQTVAQIMLSGDRGGTWHVVLGEGKVVVGRGAHQRPSFVVEMAVDTWRSMRQGELSMARALVRREVRTKGSLRAMMRVAKLFS